MANQREKGDHVHHAYQLIHLNRCGKTTLQPSPASLPASALRNLLTDARSTRIQPLAPTPDNATDLRLNRIRTSRVRIGLHLKGKP